MASRHILLTALLAALPFLLGPVGAGAASGEELFELCAQCHGSDGGGEPLFLAPAIAGMPLWYLERQLEKFRSGVRGIHPDDLAGMRMYPMSLSLKRDEELRAVADYAARLPAVAPEPRLAGGDPARGQGLYAPCSACHGFDAAGNEALGGPPLAAGSDWYLLTQLQNFKAGVRGADPRDAQGALMRPMAMMLADEQAMRDVVAYIMSLRDRTGAE